MKEKSKNIISMFHTFEKFTDLMLDELIENLSEKGISYRTMSHKELSALLVKYRERNDFVSIANICFMITENAGEI